MTKQNETEVDISSLLDGTLDDLADLPEFKPYPAGAHKVKLHIERDAKKKTIYFAKMKYISVEELNNSEDEVPAVDTETSVRFDMANEYGQGAFKKAFAGLAKQLNLSRLGDILEALRNPQDALVVTDITKDKKNADRVYVNLVEVALV